MRRKNYKEMHKYNKSIDTEYSKINLSFINSLSKYNPKFALRTQLQGSTHIAVDSTRPLRTQL